MITAHPLHWPIGYLRTKYKKGSAFRQTADKAQSFLRSEISKLGATGLIISSNVPVRKDGLLYSDMMNSRIDDPGVAIYFKYKGNDVTMCCDRYERVWENIYALGKGIEAIRGMERWGVSDFMERAFTGFKALPESVDTQSWHQTLGINPSSDVSAIKEAYRRMAQAHHPDAGGSVEMFNKINKAYQDGLKEKS